MKKIIFGMTENCGTCKVAMKMLKLASESFDIPVEVVNISANKGIIEKYKISSTPAFIFLDDDRVVEQFYAFHSVTFLFEKIRSLENKKNPIM